jgi:hypothetical protein
MRGCRLPGSLGGTRLGRLYRTEREARQREPSALAAGLVEVRVDRRIHWSDRIWGCGVLYLVGVYLGVARDFGSVPLD